jgi:hypothetical protein
MSDKSSQQTYASALAREFLQGNLSEKPNEVLEPVAGLIDDKRSLRLLMHYRSLWPELKRREQRRREKLEQKADTLEERGRHQEAQELRAKRAEMGSLPESFGETRLARRIIGNRGSLTLDSAFRSGNVSQLQGAVGLTKSSEDAADALTEITRRLAQPGTIAVVTGPPGAGKTATTLDLSRAWGARTGGQLLGVTSWEGFDRLVSSDTEMLEAMAQDERPALGVLDETMQELTGRGADASKAEKFADRASLIRKEEEQHGPHAKKGSLLLVSHVWGRMNKPTREMATLVIQKPSRSDPGKVVLYDSQGGEDTREQIGEYTGLTDTRETYPEHEASSFSIDMEYDQDADQEDDGPDAEEAARRAYIETAIQLCEPWDDDSGLSYPKAAEKVPYSSSWVGDRVREWNNGQHRDLVSGPNEETV